MEGDWDIWVGHLASSGAEDDPKCTRSPCSRAAIHCTGGYLGIGGPAVEYQVLQPCTFKRDSDSNFSRRVVLANCEELGADAISVYNEDVGWIIAKDEG